MKKHLQDLHTYLSEAFNEDPKNIIVLYYYTLTCLLVRKFANCVESLKLLNQIYELNYVDKNFIVLDYFKAKAVNIQSLLARLLQHQAKSFKF